MVRPAPALRRTTATARVLAMRDGAAVERPDRLATEEPMEIRAGGPGQEPISVAVTMRTPGSDFELAVGFLYTEGLIRSPQDIDSVAYCDLPEGEQQYNVVTVRTTGAFDLPTTRNFYATSSCGVCGKASLEQVAVRCAPVREGPVVAGSVLVELPEALRASQRIFEETGGLHAAGLFEASGRLETVREDVGRHNAVDKLVGQALLSDRMPPVDRILFVSGRVSFEIVQKAAMAGLPIIGAVSAPSSLAVDAADGLGVTVVGFVRHRGFNVYSHPERVDLAA